jgi:hypothetical protein
MYFVAKSAAKAFINRWQNYFGGLTLRQRQWLWFIALWLCGFAAIFAVSKLLKVIIQMLP